MASSEGNNSLNATFFLTSFSQTDGVIWCTALVLVSLFVVIGNALSLGIFALNKKLRKKSFLLVINMAFADLMLGVLALPLYIYHVGKDFKLWTALSSCGHSLCPGVNYNSYFYRCGKVFCSRVAIETSIVSKKTNLLLFNCSRVVFFCSNFNNSHPLFSYFFFHLYLHLGVICLYLNPCHCVLLYRNMEKLQDRKKVIMPKPQRAANEDLVDCNISSSSFVASNDYSKRFITLYSDKPQYFTFR